MKKKTNIFELIHHINEDDTLSTCEADIKYIGCMPGCRSHVVCYKGTFVVLHDIGNSHFVLRSAASLLDVLQAIKASFIDAIGFKIKRIFV